MPGLKVLQLPQAGHWRVWFVTMKDLPGHPNQLWQEGCDCFIPEASQLSHQFIEEICSLSILLRDRQSFQFSKGIQNSISLLWGWCGLGALKGQTHLLGTWKKRSIKGVLLPFVAQHLCWIWTGNGVGISKRGEKRQWLFSQLLLDTRLWAGCFHSYITAFPRCGGGGILQLKERRRKNKVSNFIW